MSIVPRERRGGVNNKKAIGLLTKEEVGSVLADSIKQETKRVTNRTTTREGVTAM
jgi:hypothetical protein